MQFLKVGHSSQHERGTGVSVFLFNTPAVGAYLLCGSSPASHELSVLELESNVSHVDGLVFLGGSAYGLSAVSGVMRWFQEQGRGWPTPQGVVPIVPAASIFDLAIKAASPPTSEEAYQACISATEDNVLEGRIGAGTGASVGKCIPHATPMTGGVGCAERRLPNGTCVMAYAVVNSIGDVRDVSGKIIAGARGSNGEFADCENYLLSGQKGTDFTSLKTTLNTTLVAVFTNAKFSKIELKRITKVAVAGMARAISPVFTRYDGDIIFGFSLGEYIAEENVVGVMAAEVVRQAIVNAVKHSITV